ncbi:MAG: PDZ domain-containing protein [Candidatus Tectomicrobia bacterium]|uniref:PDZ domain-containing protein n=1 Tax=Tectimicrobiota bacterium TaxID=2528274 RepID=A0A938B0E8_UNCTE|nr:PDZ domain-containing protein [Candidatus Tectomicrobia bacterium]
MIVRVPWVIGLLVLSLVSFLGCSSHTSSAPAPSTPEALSATAQRGLSGAAATGFMAAFQGTLGQIYTQVNPSVVNIRTVQRQTMVFPVVPEIPGYPFPQGPQEFVRQGSGSGFVWDALGHIVTNNHVVQGADRITVTFYDDTIVSAKIVGTDPESDLAVVKVDVAADLLRPAQLGDSTQVNVGELAITIGNPFGLQSTMTVGIISALGRVLPIDSDDPQEVEYTIPDIIQTDAPINPGSSGGVLVNNQGLIIGVTSAIISPLGVSIGIGFAIPAVIVQKVVPALIKTKTYKHPWLGVSGVSLTSDLAGAMGLPTVQRGALVVEVLAGSPAEQAGLRGSDRELVVDGEPARLGGDVVIAIDNRAVKTFDDLLAYLARATEVGQTVSLTILRQGKEETMRVTLNARPRSETPHGRASRGSNAWLGIVGQTLTPQVAQAMRLSANQRGVLIEKVERGSPADQARLHGNDKTVFFEGRRVSVGGDVIVAFDDKPITQLQDLQTLMLRAQPGQAVTLTVLRHGKRIKVHVTLTERPAARP